MIKSNSCKKKTKILDKAQYGLPVFQKTLEAYASMRGYEKALKGANFWLKIEAYASPF